MVHLTKCLTSLAIVLAVLGIERLMTGQPPSPPAPPQAASGSITILVNGIPIATGGTINIRSGQGVIASASPNPALNGTNIQFDADSNVVLEVEPDQAWQNHILKPSGDGHTFAVSTNPVFTVLYPGQLFSVIPSTAF